jgi:hypothetical protein
MAEKKGKLSMEWFKQHADTIVILGSFALCFWNMNEKMNDNFNDIGKEIAGLKTDIAVVKAVMIIQKIMPAELATKD